MRVRGIVVAALVVAALGGVARGQTRNAEAQAQDRFLQQQRMADDQLKQQRATRAPLNSLLDFQWGGWIDYYLFEYSDGLQKSRFVQRPSLAIWTRIQLDDGAHEIFARERLKYTWFRPGDQIDLQEDWFGPEFDQAWYQIDFGKAFRLTKPSDPVQLKTRVGRQEVIFGTGYTLDLPMDALLLDGKLYDVHVLGLVGKSIRNYPNIDRSPAVQSHSDRMFYGVQLAYEGWQKHVPFVYALWNPQDKTKERPSDWLQAHEYESFYIGTGARGELAHNLNYWIEGVWESGHSYGDHEWHDPDYIAAYGWDMGIEKLFDVPTRPRIVGEYMFASGDRERLYSPTNATGGNVGDARDSSFVGFGYRDTGISAAPTLSNLHVWRAGASFLPLEKVEFLRNFELGTNWFLYHKNKTRGAISDPTADDFNGYVGWEMDYYLNWRLSSDLSWTIRWGTFFPGGAYSDQDTRHFVFSGFTWSF